MQAKAVMLTIIFIALMITISSCTATDSDSSTENETVTADTESANSTAAESTIAAGDSGENEENQEVTMTENSTITITVNGTTMQASLEPSSSAKAFIDMLSEGPITVEMHDYANMEKVGALESSLPTNDKRITTSPGDIILYQGNQITIYYDENTWSFTRLGKIENISSDELRAILGTQDATVTFSLP